LVAKPTDLPSEIIGTVILQSLYPFLALGAATRQLVKWRGISYRIGRKRRIEMVQYKPFPTETGGRRGRSID
jgi:hypothetical protein